MPRVRLVGVKTLLQIPVPVWLSKGGDCFIKLLAPCSPGIKVLSLYARVNEVVGVESMSSSSFLFV